MPATSAEALLEQSEAFRLHKRERLATVVAAAPSRVGQLSPNTFSPNDATLPSDPKSMLKSVWPNGVPATS